MMASILLAGSGCEGNFEPKIYGDLFSTNFPKTESDYESYFLIGYHALSAVWSYQVYDGDVSHRPFYAAEGGVMQCFDTTADYMAPTRVNTRGGAWIEWTEGNYANAIYYGTNGSNINPMHFQKIRQVTRLTKILGTIRDATILSEGKKTAFMAETRLLRGIIMYYLMHIYGPVPVIVDPDLVGNIEAEKNMARPSLEQMVEWIYDDFDYARQYMPNTAPLGRYTADYARFFLMKHCLNEGFYDKAIEMYQELKSSEKNYGLFTEGANPYVEQFKPTRKFNKEVIMAISVGTSDADARNDAFTFGFYVVPSNASRYADAANTIPTFYAPLASSFGNWFNVSPVFYDTYESGDHRRDVVVTSYVLNDASRTVVTKDDLNSRWDGYIILKFPMLSEGPWYDFPLARWADVLLMYAEAVARTTNAVPTGEAMQGVNDVRARAGLAPLSGQAVANYNNFMDALLLERGHEFLYEGFRKIDLIRFNKFRRTLREIKDVTPTHQYVPLPNYAVRAAEQDGIILEQVYERPNYSSDN